MIIFCIMFLFLVVWSIIHHARSRAKLASQLANKNDLAALFAVRDKEDAALDIEDYKAAAYYWQEGQNISKRLDDRKA